MTDPCRWKWEQGTTNGVTPDPDPEPLPENWQAIAEALINDLSNIITPLLRVRGRLRAAIVANDYNLFRQMLELLEEWANDRPKP